MPICRTLVTAGDHIDWITTSPEAIRLTLSLNSFQKRPELARLLELDHVGDRLVDLLLGHVAHVAILDDAAGLRDLAGIHDADRRDVQDRRPCP